MGKVLVVDDEGKMRAVLAMALDGEGHEVAEAESAETALERLSSFAPEVVITDMRMGGASGLELLRRIKGARPDTEVIVMTAYADAGSGIEAMRGGALEYVAKPFEMDEMLLLVKRALESGELRQEVSRLRDAARERYSLGRIVGSSKAMQEVVRQARMVAGRDTTVLIRGSSGTGKELVARGIHAESGRDPFIPVNCGAIPENLLESELFGHEKGAFTGATDRKTGLFEQADGGTLFLDEVGDIPLNLQVKLLRVLQERELVRVGGAAVIKTTARVIAATNRNLEEAVERGEFREDLYYRLNVFPLRVPSLAERTADIAALVDAFRLKYRHTQGVEDGVMGRLMEYSWPGNVRELENCIERAAIMAGDGPIGVEHLPEHIRNNHLLRTPAVFRLPEEGISLDELERNLLTQALERAGNNKSIAARLLGISRRAIYSKMKTHRLSGGMGDEAAEGEGEE